MTKFKVGDRVRVYSGVYGGDEGSVTGVVHTVDWCGNFKLVMDGDRKPMKGCWFHPKQARRLVGRREREVYWIGRPIGSKERYKAFYVDGVLIHESEPPLVDDNITRVWDWKLVIDIGSK